MIESESEYKSVKYRYLKPWNTFSFSSLGTRAVPDIWQTRSQKKKIGPLTALDNIRTMGRQLKLEQLTPSLLLNPWKKLAPKYFYLDRPSSKCLMGLYPGPTLLGTPSLSPQPSLSILLSQGFDLGLFD